MKKFFNILLNLPVVMYICSFIYITIGAGLNISWIAILNGILLLLTGVIFSLNNKKYNKMGFIPLGIFVVINAINGYYDYLKWASTIIAIVNLGYYILILLLKRHYIKD